MPHWSIPTTQEVAVEGGTFFVNACGHPTLADRNRSEDPKKVTCKMCKEAFKMPRTRESIAARLLYQIERARQSDFAVRVVCNACDKELDVHLLGSNHTFLDVRLIEAFLVHTTYEHSLGAEVLVYVEDPFLSVYEQNRAMGRTAGTKHEEAWRERHALGGGQSFEDAGEVKING